MKVTITKCLSVTMCLKFKVIELKFKLLNGKELVLYHGALNRYPIGLTEFDWYDCLDGYCIAPPSLPAMIIKYNMSTETTQNRNIVN